jgi:uncharacterized membrane protein
MMDRYVTVGLGVLAGAVLFEAALIPAIVIGGGAVLAARYLAAPRSRRLPDTEKVGQAQRRPGAELAPRQNDEPRISLPAGLRIKQAVAKTITFRIIVTGLDFSTNYLMLGEIAVAAGLSAFSLAVGPGFYFLHEALWNYLTPPGSDVNLPALRAPAADAPAAPNGIAINRPLAKTITFRTIATALDFTTNYIVITDAATAVALTAFGFVLGPFVYLGHEMLWDHYGASEERGPDLAVPTNRSLPIAASATPRPERSEAGAALDTAGRRNRARPRMDSRSANSARGYRR